MKNINITILHPEDEALILSVLEAFRSNSKIELEINGEETPVEEEFDKNDEEILDLLDQADREKGVPYGELRKRFGL
jgi:hypothetical protein